MRIAILGAGAVGGTLGMRWAGLGHEVLWGVRDPRAEKVLALVASADGRASALPLGEAAAAGEVLVLATPWRAAQDALRAARPPAGRPLLDVTNPLRADLSGLEPIPLGSAAQQVAAWAPGTRVVKVFNTIGVKVIENPRFGSARATALYCGDDAAVKTIAAGLAAELGFDPVDAGGLDQAALLEEMAMLWIRLALTQHRGLDFAFGLLQR